MVAATAAYVASMHCGIKMATFGSSAFPLVLGQMLPELETVNVDI